MTTRRHFTAWMATGSSVLDQPNMDVTIIEDALTGADGDDPRAWSSGVPGDAPHPFYAMTEINAREGDAEDGIKAAEALMAAAGWRVVSKWEATPDAYTATVERDEEGEQ
jgi:hypothetical protein